MRLAVSTGLAVLAVLAAPAAASAISASETFDTGLGGWVALQAPTDVPPMPPPDYHATGGNPGGYISLTDTNATTFGIATLRSGSGFTGDFSGAYGGTLSFDLRTNTAWASTSFLPWISITGAGPQTAVCSFPTSAVPADGNFHTLTATLTETAKPGPDCSWEDMLNNAGALFTNANFKAILASLQTITVSADVNSAAGETVSLDNVRLTGLPDTTLTSTPPPLITTNSATFAFTSDGGAGVTFECQLDGLGFTPCTSPYVVTGLFNGAHTFAVRSILGTLVDPTPAAMNFAVDVPGAVVTPPGGTPPGGTTTTARPRLQNVTLTGGRLLFTASVAGTVNLTIARATKGHRKPHKSCSRKLRHGRACTLYTTVFHGSRSVPAGAGRLTFGRTSLKRGRYRATLTLTAGGKTSTPVVRTFTVK
jgi:Laminin B (Domain IV)